MVKERRFPSGASWPPERAGRTLSTSFLAALPSDQRDRVAARNREPIATPSLAENRRRPFRTRPERFHASRSAEEAGSWDGESVRS
jgi:hypothetical protein